MTYLGESIGDMLAERRLDAAEQGSAAYGANLRREIEGGAAAAPDRRHQSHSTGCARPPHLLRFALRPHLFPRGRHLRRRHLHPAPAPSFRTIKPRR